MEPANLNTKPHNEFKDNGVLMAPTACAAGTKEPSFALLLAPAKLLLQLLAR